MTPNWSIPAGFYSDANFDTWAMIDLSSVNYPTPLYAWIEYNGVLNVTISTNSTKPPKPLISESMDLTGVLKEFMYVGFTSANGVFDNRTSSIAENKVYTWSFSTGEDIVKDSNYPSNGTGNASNMSSNSTVQHSNPKYGIIAVSVFVSLLSVFMIVTAVFCYLHYREGNEKNRKFSQVTELDRLPEHYGAHKIRYQDLSEATRKFSEKEKLGKGGFGWVYKGVLPTNKVEVAVKRFCKTSKQGAREFVAEVKIIGRMRHRNLVPLLGWCHHKPKGELLLVYEYMPNGSLDRFIFRQDKILSWEQRAKILIGVATALHFLHEEYEQRVVHRDVKASNVMLDADFNARLGDFGLARLYDHSQEPQSTLMLAGTLGYMAPELFNNGKATEKTDVYSFGALALEVATGRRAARNFFDDDVLVDWVWSLFASGNIRDAADIRLGRHYNEEIELVLHVGLLCSHPDPHQRPTMRQSLNYLTMEAPFPVHMLPCDRPRPTFPSTNLGPCLNKVDQSLSYTINTSTQLQAAISHERILLD